MALFVLALLTPVVLALGIHWKLEGFRPDDFRIEVTRATLTLEARRFLESRGVTVGDAEPSVRLERNPEFHTYLHWLTHKRQRGLRPLALPVTPHTFELRFEGENGGLNQVAVAPDGRVVGFSFSPGPSRGSASTDARERAMLLAQQALSAALRSPERYQLSSPRIYELTADSGEPQLRVEWTATQLEATGVSFLLRFGISGDYVFLQEITAAVSDEAQEAIGLARSFRGLLVSMAPLYFLGLVVYMLVRYLQRTAEKEVSHGRAIVIGLYAMVILIVIFLAGDAEVLLNISFGDGDAAILHFFALFMISLLALLGGACYAACEGEVREQFPRSLTSFDALLTGRLLSKNVARAFLGGFVAACWLFAYKVVVNLRFEGGVEEPASLTSLYQLVVSNVPALSVFLLAPMEVGFVMLFGYLAPLSVVARLQRLRLAAWLLLALMSFVNLTILHGAYATPASLLFTIAAEATLLLWLIVAVDLLTAYVCLVLVGYLTLLTDAQLLTVFPDDLQWWMHAVVAITVIAALALMRWGRELSDEAVRPAYARALAERQLLSQQISTAALAQQQLMLPDLPGLEGFSLAAECRPARAVSGDYFDYFPMGDRRAGLLLISGAGRGLLDAMVMAYAKGYLMEFTSRANSSSEILVGLMDALTSVLEPDDRFPELCFLLLDASTRVASYSRTQGFPEPLVVRERDAPLPSVRAGGGADLLSKRIVRGDRTITLSHGAASLDSNSTVLVYSRGFSSGLHLAGILDVREWLRQQWRTLDVRDAQSTLRSLHAAAMPRSRAWQHSAPAEDLTLLVAQFTGEATEEQQSPLPPPSAGRERAA